ncbi:hypothetical protein CTAYLR_000914 [Chrysophaeum taylorii]|uniref:Rieske domain-containing protein n=1 Tax=Chrysophaeum taylorii TaxID=2483200 RepID=A0AAD7UFA3_9STRA|nr:hypothetical protein CTAYLR_000914 [Chrysophaeum taylorii]
MMIDLLVFVVVVVVGAWVRHTPTPRVPSHRRATVIGEEEATRTVDWLAAWYPVCFSNEVRKDTPYKAQVFERPMVLFRDKGDVVALADECPHRLAPLSDGRLVDLENGSTGIECSYHGWQLDGCGKCVVLPQLEGSSGIGLSAPAYAVTERQGIVFVALKATDSPVPTIDAFDDPSWIYEQDYARDLPYDYTTLLENVCDPSHVPVSHHGTSQGDRSLARPMATRLLRADEDKPHPLSFEGEVEVALHGSSRLGFESKTLTQRVRFEAPGRLTYSFDLPTGQAVAAFYVVPVARGRSRVLVRRGRNFRTEAKMSRAALVAKHLENNVVFDQDVEFLVGQEHRLQARRLDGYGGAWRDYKMPTSADKFVVWLRKRLDACAPSMPWRSPLNPPKLDHDKRALLDRYAQHTAKCEVCSEALELTKTLKDRAKTIETLAPALALFSASATLPSALVLLALSAYLATRLATAYVVGPALNAGIPNWLGLPAVALSVAHLAALSIRAGGPLLVQMLAFAAAAALGTAAHRAHAALTRLEARFVYTDEAKALQHAP